MFGIGPVEFAVVLVVALLVMGPKKLPELARTVGKGLAEFRRASTDLKRSFEMDLPSHEIEDVPGPAQASSPQAPATPGTALEEIERQNQASEDSGEAESDDSQWPDDRPVPASEAPATSEASETSAEPASVSSDKPATESSGD